MNTLSKFVSQTSGRIVGIIFSFCMMANLGMAQFTPSHQADSQTYTPGGQVVLSFSWTGTDAADDFMEINLSGVPESWVSGSETLDPSATASGFDNGVDNRFEFGYNTFIGTFPGEDDVITLTMDVPTDFTETSVSLDVEIYRGVDFTGTFIPSTTNPVVLTLDDGGGDNTQPVCGTTDITVEAGTDGSGFVNVTDADGDTLTFTLNSDGGEGTASVNADGTFTYTANTTIATSDSFTVDVTDGTDTVTCTVNVTITQPANNAPICETSDLTVESGATADGTVNVTDADTGDTHTFTLNSDGGEGTASVNADGSFTYTANTTNATSDTFTVDVTDGTDTVTCTVDVSITQPVTDDITSSRTHEVTYSSPGSIDVSVIIEYTGSETVTALAVIETIPANWTFDSVTSSSAPEIEPAVDDSGTLAFSWISIPDFPITLAYRLNVPAGESGTKFFIGDVKYRTTGNEISHTTPETTLSGVDIPLALTLNITENSISEDGGTSEATVTRNGDTTDALVVFLDSTDLSEATVPATVTIAAGDTEATFDVTAVNDDDVDGDQTVTITASATGFNDGTDSIDVTDDDVADVTITESDGTTEVTEGGDTDFYTVVLTSEPTATVTIDVGVDSQVTVDNASIVFTPANWNVAQTVTVTAVDDDAVEGTHGSTISHIITTTDTDYTAITPDSVTVSIIDNDSETLTLSIDADSISEDGGTSEATVTRNGDTTDALVVFLDSTDLSEATVPATVTIAAGDVSATFTVTAVNDDDVDGDQTVTITASATNFTDGTDSIDITDDDTVTLALTISIDADSITEDGGTSQATVIRNGDTTNELVVTLNSDDTSEAIVDTTVTIAAGDVSAIFTVTAVDDDNVDGNQTVTITASATNFTDGSDSIEVTDSDIVTLALNLNITEDSILEDGGISQATVTRNGDTTNDLEVALATSDDTEATVPATVTIAAGDVSATFTVTAVNDDDVDGDQTVTITASATNFTDGTDSIDITDDDTVTLALTISIDADSISEDGGTSQATVIRNGDTTNELVVTLNSDDTSEAIVDTTVTIAAGDVSATFTVTAVNDDDVDGDQTVTITASATNFTDGTDSIDITDDDTVTLALTISIDADSITEDGGTSQATVIRNGDTTNELVVTLNSDDTSEAIVDTTVTIVAGSDSATFTVTAVDDDEVDGDQTVTVVATANGFTDGTDSIDITDDDTNPIVETASPGVATDLNTPSSTVSESIDIDEEATEIFQVTISGGTLPYSYAWLLSDSPVGENSPSFSYTTSFDTVSHPDDVLEQTLICTVTDDAGVMASITWSSLQIFDVNRLPSITGSTITVVSGGNALLGDDLRAEASGWNDDDGDDEEFFYQWQHNGSDIEGETSDTLLLRSSFFDIGDQITVIITPFDGIDEGTPVSSAPITIVDTPGDWQLAIDIAESSNATREEVIFGMQNGASDGVDFGIDQDVAPQVPKSTFADVYFDQNFTSLSKDIRGQGDTAEWLLVVDPRGNTVELSWDSQQIPDGKILSLYEVDFFDETPVPGDSIMMNLSETLVIDGDEERLYRIRYADDFQATVTLFQGWNLLSLPLAPNTPAVEDVFSDGILEAAEGESLRDGRRGLVISGSVWAWEDDVYVPVTTIEALKGYWVFFDGDAPKTILVDGTPSLPDDNGDLFVFLSQGWNLYGSIAPISITYPLTEPLQGTIWFWDGVEYQETTTMHPFRGHWINSFEPDAEFNLAQ